MNRYRTSALRALIAAALIAPMANAFAQGKAAQSAPEAKKEARHTRGVSVLVTALDTDKDGGLSAEEIAAAAKSLRQLDRNSDGRISGEEFHPTLRPVQSPTAEIMGRLMEFDKDSDDKLSKAEIPDQMQTLIEQADTNKDGVLDKAELNAFVEKKEKPQAERRAERKPRTDYKQRRTATTGEKPGVQTHGKDTFVNLGGNMNLTRRLSRILVALDTNKDMQISAEEIANAPASLKALDTDGDAKISVDELSSAGTTEFVSPDVKAELKKEAESTANTKP